LKPSEALGIFWDLAHLDHPVLSNDDLGRFPAPLRQALIDARLVKPGRTANSVECDGCGEGHVGEVIRSAYPDGQTRLFIVCPECGRVPVTPERLRQWVPDYSAVGDLLTAALQVKGARQEIVPGRLWDLGRAALAGQSRPVWLVRRFDATLRERLPSDKLSVVFVLGVRLRAAVGIDEDRVFEVRNLIAVEDGKLVVDVDAVRGQLGEMVRSAPVAKPNKKRMSRAATIDAMKFRLRDQVLMRKSTYSKNWDAVVPRFEQKDLAEQVDVHESTVSRILREETQERELQILWQIVNDPEQIMRYQG
jgi:hypothetical protein